MGSKHRECIACGKRRDLVTDLCPTPDACAKLRAPGKRAKARDAEARGMRRIERAAARVGVDKRAVAKRMATFDPQSARMRAEGQRAARIGWKKR